MIDFFQHHPSPFPGTIGSIALAKELDPMTEKLGRFGHHPDPAIDFEIEVEAIEGCLFDAIHGISKPGTPPMELAEIRKRVERAMDFRVGAELGTVDAKRVLRKIEADLKAKESGAATASIAFSELEMKLLLKGIEIAAENEALFSEDEMDFAVEEAAYQLLRAKLSAALELVVREHDDAMPLESRGYAQQSGR